MGLQPETIARLMAQLGFRTARGKTAQWVWQGLVPAARPTPPPADNAFAALGVLRRE